MKWLECIDLHFIFKQFKLIALLNCNDQAKQFDIIFLLGPPPYLMPHIPRKNHHSMYGLHKIASHTIKICIVMQ